jgi:hypothetical protein
MATSIMLYKKIGAMVKDLNFQCEGEGFKFSHLQTNCIKLLGRLTWLGY